MDEIIKPAAFVAEGKRVAFDRVERLLAAYPAIKLNPAVSETLDISRWLSAALVLIYHLRVNLFPDPSTTETIYRGLSGQLFLALASCGQQAVFVFFVISGFLVGGGAIADLQRGRFTLKRYASHRVARIYTVLIPALVVGLVFDAIRVHAYGLSHDAGHETGASYAATTIIGNLLCLQTIFVPTAGSNSVLWSLANEVWYYVLFGCLLAALNGDGRTRVSAAIVGSGALAVIAIANFKIVALMALWLIGVLARFAKAPLMRAKAPTLILTILLVVTYPYTAPYLRYAHALMIALCFANLIVATMTSNVAAQGKHARAHAALAGFSFSLYIAHAPLMHLLLCWLNNSPSPAIAFNSLSFHSLSIFAGVFALSVFFAFSFGRLTEAHTNEARRVLARVWS